MKNTLKSLTVGIILFLFLVILFSPGEAYGYESILKFELTPGPYAVGFKTMNNYDYSRTFYSDYTLYGEKVTQKARPVQTSIWYPANVKKAESSERMKFIDYAYLMSQELGYKELTQAVKAEALTEFHLFFSTPEDRKPELEVLTNAVRDAEPAEGTFPLVVYGASINCVSFENSVLFEYLASHGYIVVSSPCLGESSRYVTVGLGGTEAQARDMLYLLGMMEDFPGVDKTKVAMLGFSWGGMSGVLAAMRDSRIDAVICMDGSVAYNKYIEDIASKSLYYNTDKMTMPLLFMRSKQIPVEIMKRYGGVPQEKDIFFEELKYSNAYYLRFNHLMHGDFCSTFIRFMDTKGPDKLESSAEEINRSHNLVCQYVRCFLDANLKGDATAMQFMSKTPQENNIAEGVIDWRYKAGLKLPPSFGEFAYRVKQEGFDKISGIYNEIKKEYPDFTVAEGPLTDLAFQLFTRGKLDQVLMLLHFVLEVYPNSSDAYHGLAKFYEAQGKIDEAIKALEKAVELNPRAFSAQKRLTELKESTGK